MQGDEKDREVDADEADERGADAFAIQMRNAAVARAQAHGDAQVASGSLRIHQGIQSLHAAAYRLDRIQQVTLTGSTMRARGASCGTFALS